jgi:hypothetical protein
MYNIRTTRQNEKLTLVLTFSDKYNKYAGHRWTTSSHPRMGTLARVRVSMEQLYAPNIYQSSIFQTMITVS